MEIFLLQILHLHLACRQRLCLRQEGVGTTRRHREERGTCSTGRKRSIPQRSGDGFEWRHKEQGGKAGQEFGDADSWSSSGV